MGIIYASANKAGVDASQFETTNERYYFTGSGRVDNRKKLKVTLGVAEVSDEDLLWLAFLKWCILVVGGALFAFQKWQSERISILFF